MNKSTCETTEKAFVQLSSSIVSNTQKYKIWSFRKVSPEETCANANMLITHCFLCVTRTIWVRLTEMSDSLRRRNAKRKTLTSLFKHHHCGFFPRKMDEFNSEMRQSTFPTVRCSTETGNNRTPINQNFSRQIIYWLNIFATCLENYRLLSLNISEGFAVMIYCFTFRY